jgi:NlpC/P60 family putative phage cell wall peptidase
MVSRNDIVAAARSWIGTPYRHQGALKGVGCDCLGLLVGMWREVTGEAAEAPPPYTRDWAEAQRRETFAEAARRHMLEIAPAMAREGDVVLFRWRAHLPAKHAGILVAADRMVHAQEHAAVAEVPLSPWWRRRIAYAFSFPGVEPWTAAPLARSVRGCQDDIAGAPT